MSTVNQPTLPLLLSKLLPVVEWETLGLHLDIPKHELEKIRVQFFHEGVEKCKAEMLDLWLKRNNVENINWNVISDALRKMKGLEELVQEISQLTLSQEEREEEPNPTTTTRRNEEQASSISVAIPKLDMKRFSQLESKFAKLISSTLQELKSCGVSIDELHSYVKIRLELRHCPSSPLPQSLDELVLDRLKPYYCLTNLSLIDNIIGEFLEGSKVQEALDEYEKQLESFKTSTKMEELVDHMIEERAGGGEEGVVSVVLKLEGSWLGVTLKHFQQLIEEIFLERSCCFNHIQVKRGCLCVSMIVPQDITSSLVSLAKQRIEFINSIGIIRLFIGGNEIINKEKEEDQNSFSRYLIRGVIDEKVDVVQFILSLDTVLVDISSCIEAAVELGNIEMVSILLESGANPNIIGNKGSTPLQRASKNGHIAIVEKLIKYKADPNQVAIDGATALMLASNYNHLDILNILLSAGAQVNKAMADGWTALMFACDQNYIKIVQRLLKAGADPNVSTHSSKCSPVYFATSKYSDPSVLLALAEAGADLNVTTYTGATPLVIASQLGFETTVEVLLNLKASLDRQTKHGFTALMAAAHKGHVGIAENLLLAGADTRITDTNGRTALDWSLQSKHPEITQLLLLHMGGTPAYRRNDDIYNVCNFELRRISEDLPSPKFHPSIMKLKEAMRESSIPEGTEPKCNNATQWKNLQHDIS